MSKPNYHQMYFSLSTLAFVIFATMVPIFFPCLKAGQGPHFGLFRIYAQPNIILITRAYSSQRSPQI